MNDTIKTIKAQLYERAISPLSSTFILSWCIWNWRFIIILFSNMPVEEKFKYIDIKIYPTFPDIIANSLFFPLVVTLFIIYIYPIPAKYVFKYWRKQQIEQKKIQQEIEDNEPLTKEEARLIKKTAWEAEQQLEIEYEKRNKEREEKNRKIKELEDHNVSLESEIEKQLKGSNDFRALKFNNKKLESNIETLESELLTERANRKKEQEEKSKKIEELRNRIKLLESKLNLGSNPANFDSAYTKRPKIWPHTI
jgi:hypothetical protein